jgi:hypothetical protein
MPERTFDESNRRSADAFEIASAALGSSAAAARAYQDPDNPEMIRAAVNPGPKNVALMNA